MPPIDTLSLRRLLAIVIAATSVLSVGIAGAEEADPTEPQVAVMKVYLTDIARDLSQVWPNNRMVTVICHGHSVPAGYFRTPEIRPFDSYPHLAHALVQRRYPTGMVEFIRTAKGGEHAEAGAERFDADVIAKNPDVVCIDYALNDRSIGLLRARRAWEQMIRAALNHGAKVILFTPTADLAAREDTPDGSLEAHAEQIRELAAEFGVGLVDSHAAFQEYSAREGSIEPLMSQSNHPNRLGHQLVAELLADWFITAADHATP